MAKRAKRLPAHDVVAGLLERPPLNDGELARRLARADLPETRREIVDRLLGESTRRDDVEVLAAALLVIGVEGELDRLERFAKDPRRARAARWMALSLIFSAAPERANQVLAGLHPVDGLTLTLQPAAEAIPGVLGEAAQGETIADALEALPEHLRAEAFSYLETLRRGAGTPAVLAYRELLQREELRDLGGRVLGAVVEEGGAQTAAELMQLRDEASDPRSRQGFQRALLRLNTRAIEARSAAAPAGDAHLGICDGQGAFVLVARLENPDGTTSIADLCIRASAEIRDGFAAGGLDDQAVEDLFAKTCEAGLGALAPLTLNDAADIAFAAVERSRRMSRPIPPDARSALLLYERARRAHAMTATSPPPADARVAPPAPPRGPVTTAEARALLSLLGYETWFFDAGDLAQAGVELPREARRDAPGSSDRARSTRAPRRPRAAWRAHALGRLAGSEVAPRLTAMLAHMARWHAARGEAEPAAICAAALADTERGFADSAVAQAMLDRSVEILRSAPRGEVGTVGDPANRQRIRLELFADVDAPRGKDLAALDLTEAALFALDGAVNALPGSRRPREEDLLRAAGAVATRFVRFVLSRRRADPDALVREIEKALDPLAGPSPGERQALADHVAPALLGFVEEICTSCPVACLSRPRADVADAFFGDRHPGLS